MTNVKDGWAAKGRRIARDIVGVVTKTPHEPKPIPRAHTDEQYRRLLAACGCESIGWLASLGTADEAAQGHLMAIVAR